MSRLTLALGLALLVVEASVAFVLLATSDHVSDRGWTIGLGVSAGVAFVLSGLVAIARRPENRTGVFLAATGYLWFLSALTESNDSWVFSIGFLLGGLAFVPFAALLLSHPTGRFSSRLDAAFPLVVGGMLISLSAAVLLVDPTPLPSCETCPENALLLVDSPRAADALQTIATLEGIVLALVGVALLIRRWRRAAPALRRTLLPVFVAGGAVLAGLVVNGVVAELVSADAADTMAPLVFAAFAAVPLAFLFGILRTRLARSSVTEVVVALQSGTPLRNALADALNDPSLEVSYRLDRDRGLGGAGWVDAEGRSVAEPKPGGTRAVKVVEQGGEPVAAVTYESSPADDPELVDAVAAAAGLALRNERLRAELRAEVRLTGALADTAPSLLSIVDTDGRILKLNPATLRASGYTDDREVEGRFFWEVFIDDEERDAMMLRFAEAAPDFPPTEYENTFTNVRGERLVIYWHSAPVLDGHGRVVSIVAGGLDITERHRLEEEKARERAFLNAIANNAPSLLCLVDEHGLVQDRATNIAFEETLGFDPESTGGHVFWERYVDPAESDEARRLIERVVAGEGVPENDNHWVTSTGGRLLIAWTCTALPQLDERRLFLISGVDVTERQEREQEAERQRDFLHAITEAVPSFVIAVDPDAVVVEHNNNRAFLDAFGWSEDEIVGTSFLGLIAREDDHAARMAIANAANGVAQSEQESLWFDRTGDARIVAWSARPVMNPSGRNLVLVSGTDVTLRRRQEEEIRASRARIIKAEDDARRGLERNLHDGAQQRLVALSVQLHLVESKLQADPTAAASTLGKARSELSQALDELRELARGIHPAVLTDRGLAPALEALAARAPFPVEVHVSADRQPSPVEVAAYYVVAEALTNVAKYARAESATVSVETVDEVLVVTVADDGIGGADAASGSGLRGLADRVEALEGRLLVESPPGAGTRIRAEIPLQAAAARAEAPSPSYVDSPV